MFSYGGAIGYGVEGCAGRDQTWHHFVHGKPASGTRTYPTCVHVTRGNARMHEKEERSHMAQQWAYKVAYIDYRGRISSEGLETLIGNERRSAFARRYLNTLGQEGWELVGIQPLTANSAYYIFKRPAQEGDFAQETPPAAGEQTTPTGGPNIETA